MAKTGLLSVLLPELERLKEYPAGQPRGRNSLPRMLAAYRSQELLLNDLDAYLPGCAPFCRRLLDQKHSALLKWVMLLHDVGKTAVPTAALPPCAGHASRSAQTAKAICGRYKFSNQERTFVELIIRNHRRPRSLYALWLDGKSHRSTRFFMRYGSLSPFLLLHSYADVMAGEHPAKTESCVHFIRETLGAYFSRYQPMQTVPPLITGNDLISELGLTPSPGFKRILARVEEARINGHIKTRDSALKLAGEILSLDNT